MMPEEVQGALPGSASDPGRGSGKTSVPPGQTRELIRFLGLFALYFGIGQFLYQWLLPLVKLVVVNLMHVQAAAWVLNLIPGMACLPAGDTLTSDRTAVSIAAGCEGLEPIVLLAAAILATRAGATAKLLGIGLGSLLLYACNVLRIVLLFLVLHHRPQLFPFFHTYIGQIVIICVSILFYLFWLRRNVEVRA